MNETCIFEHMHWFNDTPIFYTIPTCLLTLFASHPGQPLHTKYIETASCEAEKVEISLFKI
jgi:hypothetical protein